MKLEELRPGLEIGPSAWIEIAQPRIDAFADVTGDHQAIHVDPVAAAAGPFGQTVAHGFLTLSLVPAAIFEVLYVEAALTINYGLNRVRFPAPVPSGSRVRATAVVQQIEPVEGGVQATLDVSVLREGSEKPVCVAELILRFLR